MGNFKEFVKKHGRDEALGVLAEITKIELEEIYSVDMGLALVVWPEDNNPDSVADYISSGSREDMIKFLRGTADRLENKEDIPRPQGMVQ